MTTFTSKYKQYVGFSRDHSGSMGHLASQAIKDYNTQISTLRDKAIEYSIDTVVSVVRQGIRSRVDRETVNSSVLALKPLSNYPTDGGTPLYDSIGELISIFEASPDYANPDVSFMVQAITDGEENQSMFWNASKLSKKIKELQATDRWTFVFRVPKGYGAKLVRALGLHDGNIQEWEQTSKGYEQATVVTAQAFDSFYQARSIGVKSSSTFYANLKDVSTADIQAVLTDISGEVQEWTVQTAAEGGLIREFVEHKTGKIFVKGTCFYELTKVEPKVGDNKQVVIKDLNTGAVYGGQAARDMIGLPRFGMARLRPGDFSHYQIFIQSTSVNRKLPAGTKLLYWPNAI